MATPSDRKYSKTIPIIKVKDEFHYKPFKAAEGVEIKKVPIWLFDAYTQAREQLRDLKHELNTYFTDAKS